MTFDVTNWSFDGYVAEVSAGFPGVADELSGLGPRSGDLVHHCQRVLREGLAFIGALPGNDAFWLAPHRANRLPTVRKLREYCQQALEEPDAQPRFAWYDLALTVLFSGAPHLPEHPVWRLEKVSEIPTRWLVEAGWLEFNAWVAGYPMRPVARALGRDVQFMAAVESVASRSHREGVKERLSAWITAERACEHGAG